LAPSGRRFDESAPPMSDNSGPEPAPSKESAAGPAAPAGSTLPPLSPENLPPVQPPSAGFILQLFVVPAIIVGAVIAIWLLFGRLASSDQDWRRQVDELRQSNEHRRWRAADSLVKMLDADLNAGADGQQLADDPELAAALVEQLKLHLTTDTTSEEGTKISTFLLMALGRLNADEVVFPALVAAMEPQLEDETRFTAVASGAMIASRRSQAGEPFGTTLLSDAFLACSSESSVEVRRIATFALGFCDPAIAQDRLVVLLDDADPSVRANAAMALAVQNSTLGLPVLSAILTEAIETPPPLEGVDRDDPEAEQTANAAEIDLIRKTLNAVKAISDLASQLSRAERDQVQPQLERLASEFRNVKVRSAALEALREFSE